MISNVNFMFFNSRTKIEIDETSEVIRLTGKVHKKKEVSKVKYEVQVQ